MGKKEKYMDDINSLCSMGYLLELSLYRDLAKYGEIKVEFNDKQKRDIKDIDFGQQYQAWYNEALAAISQLLPFRKEEFISYYKNDKQKVKSEDTYTVSDYLLSIKVIDNRLFSVSKKAVLPKFKQQLSIVDSLKVRFNSTLYEIKQLVYAELFDSELVQADILIRKGFYRAAGAICGVVLERHLGAVCKQRNLASKKKTPSISEYNEMLKKEGIIDVATWRKIQYLGDIRNLCDHSKEDEPDKNQLEDMLKGTQYIIKNVF